MPPVARHALHFVLLVGAYLLGAYVALWYVDSENQITLIWPPTGVAYAALLLYGLRWWPFIAVAVLLTHVLLAPVPAAFLPFSVAANVLGGVTGAWFVQRFRAMSTERFAIADGFALMIGGIVMLLVSAPISTLGMLQAGLVTLPEAIPAALRWAMGDLFGIIAITPAVLLIGRRLRLPHAELAGLGYGGHGEKAAWMACLAATLVAVAWIGQFSSGYALGLAFVPMSLLLWSALRFEPVFTGVANAGCAVLVATAAGLGIGGFSAPTGLADITVLIAFLCALALTPQVLSIAAHQNRVTALRLLQRARTDALTGFPNRIGFEDDVRRVMRAEAGESMVLAHLDLDQFKLVNDILSHKVGDELIRTAASALRTRLGPHDLIARTGGDEFDILLRHCPPAEAESRTQRLRDAVADIRMGSGKHVAATTVSAGLACFVAGEADFAQLLARADTACFTAKERGGNRSELAGTTRGAGVDKHSAAMGWALRLNEALEHDRFELFCQSIAPLRQLNGHARHFEILLRMRDADTGELLPPGMFFPAAERFGLGLRLDTHVVDRTLAWFEQRPEAAARVGLCSINLCAASVDDERFLAFLQQRIKRSSLAPQKLCFELTETSALRDMVRAQNFIQAVRALGCKFALDDFGTGFCSFGYIRSLDVDYFKIDGSFVREVESSPLALAIVRSIADIGRVIDKETIAECAETEAIRRRLIELGVDHAQGYAVDEPAPIERYFAIDRPVAVTDGPS